MIYINSLPLVLLTVVRFFFWIWSTRTIIIFFYLLMWITAWIFQKLLFDDHRTIFFFHMLSLIIFLLFDTTSIRVWTLLLIRVRILIFYIFTLQIFLFWIKFIQLFIYLICQLWSNVFGLLQISVPVSKHHLLGIALFSLTCLWLVQILGKRMRHLKTGWIWSEFRFVPWF